MKEHSLDEIEEMKIDVFLNSYKELHNSLDLVLKDIESLHQEKDLLIDRINTLRELDDKFKEELDIKYGNGELDVKNRKWKSKK